MAQEHFRSPLQGGRCTQAHASVHLEHRSKDWGLGVVVHTDGPTFEAFWMGDDEFRKGDARLTTSYVLQDVGPLPEIAESINKMRPKKP